jgi:sugar phosphate permease
VVLAVGMLAMTAGCTFQFGLAYLIPALRGQGLSLQQTGLLAGAPIAGLFTTLVAWGAAADRWGERVVLAIGLAIAGAVLLAATAVNGPLALGVCFLLAGAAGASVHASSGRLILGWFAANERGMAMGLRQTAQPLGVAVAALALPPLGAHHIGAALTFMGAFSAVAALLVAIAVRDAARPIDATAHSTGSPYRTPVLWRIHAASALLIVPQFTFATFALVFLVDARGWPTETAGQVLAAGQLGGAGARLAVGWWSDRIGSRTRPMRRLAIAIAVVIAALAVGAAVHSRVAVGALLVASVVSVSTNGLAFTAVAEYAGRSWAGRALGIQNTSQTAVAAVTPPVIAIVIGAAGYGPAFAAIIAFPLIAAALIPVNVGHRIRLRPATDAAPARRPAAVC